MAQVFPEGAGLLLWLCLAPFSPLFLCSLTHHTASQRGADESITLVQKRANVCVLGSLFIPSEQLVAARASVCSWLLPGLLCAAGLRGC